MAMNEVLDVKCKNCGKPFISRKILHATQKMASKKSLRLNEEDLCSECRRIKFASRLLNVDKASLPARRENLRSILPSNTLSGNEIVERRKRPGEEALKSCCFFCNSGCDCVVYVKDGQVKRIGCELKVLIDKD